MHLHGWSNHNGNALPGSMQWHTHFAQGLPLDVIWWTDHISFGTPDEPHDLSLRPGHVDPGTLNVSGLPTDPQGRPFLPGFLMAEITGGAPAASLQDGILSWHLTNSGPWFASFSYTPRVRIDPPQLVAAMWYVAAMASHPHLTLNLARGPVSSDARVEILVRLSYHYTSAPVPQSLLYRFVSEGTPPRREVANGTQVTVTVPVPEGLHTVDLDFLDDALLLPAGEDNAVQDISFVIRSRNGTTVSAQIGALRFHTEVRHNGRTYRACQAVAADYTRTTPVAEYVGCEIAALRTVEARSTHYTSFLPDPGTDLPPWHDKQAPYSSIVSYVHRHGGLVAYCHPSMGPPMSQDAMVAQLVANLLPYRCFGADMIEVGYLYRKGLDLAHHLKMWDTLNANGLYVCGTGTSDAHGGVWGPTMSPNPCASWVWARSRQPADLLDGLRRRRVYFGNPFRWQGVLDLAVGKHRMGEVGVLASDAADLCITLDPVPVGIVYLYQGLIQPGRPLRYVRDREPVDPSQPIRLDTSRSSFVRVEAHSPEGRFLFASNPVVLLRQPRIEPAEPVSEVPEGSSATVRWRVAGTPTFTGVRWQVEGEAGWRFANGRLVAPLYRATLPLSTLPAGTRVLYRIRASGQGWTVACPSPQDAPLSIGIQPRAGAERSGVLLAQVMAVPSARGADIVFALASPASVTVEVLNLAGRPVATICRGRPLPGGLQRLSWNGLGPNAVRVPAGRYLVRVSAKGGGAIQSALSTLSLAP